VNRIFLFGGNHPLLALLAATALTLFTLQGLVDPWTGEVRLRLDPSTAGLLPAEGAERELFEYSRRLFGTDESVVVALGADDVFRPDVLERVARLTLRLSEIDGVQSVLSLSTAQMLRSEAGDLVVSPALETVPEDPEAARELRAEVLGNPLFAGTLVARDASATALLVSLDRMSDTELIARGIDAQIVEAAEAEAGDLDVWIAGVAHQKTYTSHQLSSEVAWMLPAILGLVALVLAVSVRSVRGVVLPLAAIVCGLIWTLGTLALLDRQLNLVTIVVPALILTVGFTYALHVVADYYAEISADHGIDSREAVRRTLDAVAVPVLITGITTAAGFVSLTLNPIPAVRQFGFYALLGVGYTMLAALTAPPSQAAPAGGTRGAVRTQRRSPDPDRHRSTSPGGRRLAGGPRRLRPGDVPDPRGHALPGGHRPGESHPGPLGGDQRAPRRRDPAPTDPADRAAGGRPRARAPPGDPRPPSVAGGAARRGRDHVHRRLPDDAQPRPPRRRPRVLLRAGVEAPREPAAPVRR
jgi:predicted RND superfamily exporter protein